MIEINLLQQHLAACTSVQEQLRYVATHYTGRVKCATSFGMEDQLLTHYILSEGLPIPIFTLDTGRFFGETYAVWSATIQRYKHPIIAYYPEAEDTEKLILSQGPNGFYESVVKRKQCCHVRKVLPLRRALKGVDLWITGLRQEQSKDRAQVSLLEQDASLGVVKMQPLWDQSFEQIKQAISTHEVPYHPLHDKGFPSIGCMPCTRAVKPGEDLRAGRWWWEEGSQKECGLHHKEE